VGSYHTAGGSGVLITNQEGRLLAFLDDAPGVFLKPAGEKTFTLMMKEPANVVLKAVRV
jgi:hypothetical protein